MKVTKLSSIVEREYPEMTWAVRDLLPEGLTILAGKQKMGKSFLVLNIAVAVARGSYALGKLPVDKRGVLYLALEDGERRIQERSRALLDGAKAPDNLDVATEMLALDDGGLTELEEYIKEKPHTGLIIIDVLSRVQRNRAGVDPRDEIYRQIAPLQQMGLKYHVAIVAVHHLHKDKGTGDDQDRIYGSSGYAQVADCIVMLDLQRGNNIATLSVSGRDIKDQKYTLVWDEALSTWGISEDSLDYIATKPSERAKLLLAMRDKEDGIASRQELLEKLDKSSGALDQLLRDAMDNGEVVKIGRGMYQLVGMSKKTSERELVAVGAVPDILDDLDDDYDPEE
jgi:hypothetical protein